jgi:hypothetical protein
MTNLFTQLRARPLAQKAAGLFGYGILTFALVYLVGVVLLDHVLLFRIFELLWFIHVLIICNQIQRSQRELLLLALIALSPGIVNNVLNVFTLF